MKYFLLLLFFFITNVSLVELNYRFGFRASNNAIEYKLNKIDSLKDKSFEKIIFGDSVIHKSVRNVRLRDEVLDLTTTAGMTFAGIYFMLNRFLQQGNNAKIVYVFFSPLFIEHPNEVNDNFEVWFHRKNEISQIDRFGLNKLSSFQRWLNTRSSSLNFISGFINSHRLKKRPLMKEVALERGKIYTEVETRDINYKKGIEFNSFFVEALVNLAIENEMDLKFILEPINSVYYSKTFENSLYKKYFKNLDSFVDINEWGVLNDESFYDGMHFRPAWSVKFLKIINEKITKIIN